MGRFGVRGCRFRRRTFGVVLLCSVVLFGCVGLLFVKGEGRAGACTRRSTACSSWRAPTSRVASRRRGAARARGGRGGASRRAAQVRGPWRALLPPQRLLLPLVLAGVRVPDRVAGRRCCPWPAGSGSGSMWPSSTLSPIDVTAVVVLVLFGLDANVVYLLVDVVVVLGALLAYIVLQSLACSEVDVARRLLLVHVHACRKLLADVVAGARRGDAPTSVTLGGGTVARVLLALGVLRLFDGLRQNDVPAGWQRPSPVSARLAPSSSTRRCRTGQCSPRSPCAASAAATARWRAPRASRLPGHRRAHR